MTDTHSPSRRRLVLAGTASLAAAPLRLHAQRADGLRVVCGYPPGGSIDVVARKLAEKLTGRLAASVVVENRPGAAGRLSIEETRKAAPGSTLLVTPASTLTMYPHVFRQLAYDPFADLAPVSTVATTAFALGIGPRVPASVHSLADLMRWCKAQPDPVSCGHAGAGSMPHFMTLMAAREMGIVLNPIPYRGGQASMQGVAAGEVAMALATESSARALQQAGRVRMLATTWDRRSPFFPDVPSFREGGINLAIREWFGAFAPVRTPDTQVQAWAEAIRSVSQDADLRDAWDKLGLAVDAGGSAALAASMRTEHDFWGPLIKASGFTPES
ncbi:MAG: tripartite tricarboxylate transporter substrate-binding protein [Rubrivivax sp.]